MVKKWVKEKTVAHRVTVKKRVKATKLVAVDSGLEEQGSSCGLL
jgi:hypothetical protein